MKLSSIITLCSLVFSSALFGVDLEDEKNRQCRSLHLGYKMEKAEALYNEVTVQKSSSGTYFSAMTFDRGYIGMQELADGKKVMIFSVWDNSQTNDERAVGDSKRARVLGKGDGVRTGRFGGEGTGVQSFFDYEWKIGETVRFLVQAKPVKVDGTQFTDFRGWFYDNQQKKWQLMSALRTPTAGITLQRGYAFVEDFKRDYKSAKITRRALYQNTWAKLPGGKWTALTQAKFSGDRNPSLTIDAGKEGDGFFLQTGGDTTMKTNKVWDMMQGNPRTGKVPDGVEKLLLDITLEKSPAKK